MSDVPRVGQRLKVTAVYEGIVETTDAAGGFSLRNADGDEVIISGYQASKPYCTVEVLPEPRIPEPQWLGAVVSAAVDPRFETEGLWTFVRVAVDRLEVWYRVGGTGLWAWSDLVDPVLLSEGWTGW